MPIVRPEDGSVPEREPVAGERVVREPAAGARGGRTVVDEPPPGRRPGGAFALREGALVLARIVQLITAVVVLLILLGIALVVLDANAANSIVSTVHDAGSSLVGPFKDIFTDKDPKLAIAENWGIAAIVYLIVGSLIASAIARVVVPRGRAV